MKKIILTIFIALALTACAPQQEEITIGFMGPFSGGPAIFGEMMQNGLDLALEELPDNVEIKILKEDDKCKSQHALTAAKKLVEVDEVPYIIGPLCNEATVATEKMFEENEVVTITIGLPSEEIANMGAYHFSFSPEIEYLMKRIAQEMEQREIKKVAVIHMDATFEGENYKQFKKHFNGEIVVDENMAKGTTDFRTSALKIKEASPDAVMLIAHTAELANILHQLKEQDIDLPKFGIHAAETPKILEEPNSDGLIYPYPANKEESDSAKAFAQKYTTKFNRGTDPYSANVYDSLHILVNAIQECGYENKQCVKNQLASLKDYKGANGLLSVDSRGVGTYKEIMLKTVKNAQFQKLG